ncbi:hypothetical protein HAZT_HAZT009317 [Hyalella azteca]|uniref:ubiquitinyl hydrolase 1 n=1 Tax=Hyalella azteca TaxID=294128 RepID=A0A6A0GP37_HYAAZ|nr:hypothetical protein HAZT_HAZT009317 [Hyalella azteca]
MQVTDSIHQQLQLQIGKENVHIDSEDCEEGLASNVGKFEPITVDEVKEEYDVEDSEDDSVSIISSQLKPRGVVGLRNLGLTCYMNAALQVLGFSPGIASFFLNCPGSLIGIKKERPLALTYRDLIREAWHSESPSSIVPSQLYHCFKQLYPMFRAFSQQDSQEFLRYFLDEIHSELRQMVPAVYNEQDSDESEDECDSDCELRSAAGESCCSLGDAPSESRLSRDPSDGHDSEENRYETCDSGVSESETDGSPSMLFGGRKRRRRPAPQSDVDFRAAAPAKSGRRQYNKNSSKKHRSKKSQQQQYSSSIVSDLFDGQLISSVQCLTCNSISARRETFQDLSLPIPSGELSIPADKEHGSDGWVWWMFQWLMSWVWGPAVSLSHCLSAFFSADELKGDNMYSCEKCGKLRNGLKFAKVVKLPEVLVVHLKRFRHDYMFSSKISQHVAFPLSDLNLQPYLHRDCVSEVCQYSLFGVICHHGSVVGGHYTSLAQHPKTGSWFEFDDETVSFVSPEYVQRSQAYVLFYKKSNPEAEKLRGRAYALMRSHALNQSLVKFYISRQWFNKFQSFGECGPIDNRDFLCPHGGVQPRKVNIVSLLVKTVNESLWEFLKGQFGGDPPCTRLYTCPLCTSQHKELVARQRIELNTFKVLNSQSDQVFGVSMTWFSQWEKFVLDKSHNPPPAIDNTSVIKQYQQRHHSPLLFRSNSDYVSITEECWNFFQHVYGGGPAFCLRPLEPVNQFNQQHHLSQDHGQFQSSFVHPQAEPARVHSRQAKRTLLVEEVHTSSRSGTSDDENLLARARVSIENLPNTQSNNPYTAAKDCAVSNDDQNSTPLVCQEGSDATDSTACDDPPSFSSRLPLVEQQSDCEYNTEDEPEETGTFVIQQIQVKT